MFVSPDRDADSPHAAVLTSSLTFQVASTPQMLLALRPEWDTLYQAAGNGNPFLQWLWVWNWWQVFGGVGGFRRHRLQVFALRDEEDKLRAVVPFVLTAWGAPPLGGRMLRLFGFSEQTTELRASLIWLGWETAAARCTGEALRARAATYDWCVLEGIAAGGPLHAWFEAQVSAGGGLWGETISDYLLPLPETWEALRARLGRNVKENIRHSYNSLQREGHEWRFECVSDSDGLPGALDEFFRLHAARSAMPNAPFHPDHYGSPNARGFLKSAAHALAGNGGIRICRLHVGAAVVASRIVLTAGDVHFLSYSGFDPAWRRYGVMTLLTTECIKLAITVGARGVNLSTGTDASKLRWGPEEVVLQSVQLFSSTRRGRMAASLHRYLLAMKKRWMRSNPP